MQQHNFLNNNQIRVINYKFSGSSNPGGGAGGGIIPNIGHHPHPKPNPQTFTPITAGSSTNSVDFVWKMNKLKGNIYNNQTAAHQHNEHSFSVSQNYSIQELIDKANKERLLTKMQLSIISL